VLEHDQFLNQRYRLIRKLGHNAGRQTWYAEDIANSPAEPVIVKLLAFNPQMQWDDLKLFEREANVLKQLDNPYIPKYREYFSIDDRILRFGLVQTYIPGISIKDLLTQGRKFSESEVQNIAVSLLKILSYLHKLSPAVLHRDIKPSNILIGEDGKVYLVDFGAVQARAAIEGATFTVVGTYGYTPMEQFGGRAVPASDLYALGATLIHILTGVAPADLPQQNMRIQFREHLSVSSYFINWIEILTEPSVEHRFQTTHQALVALTTSPSKPKTTLSLQKSCSSRILIKRSLHELRVKVQKRGARASDSFIIFWILLLYGSTIPFAIVTFPFVILFWLVGLIPLSMLMFLAFSETNLWFNRSDFVLEWKLLGVRYRSIKEYTSVIQNIYEEVHDFNQVRSKALTAVVIQAGEQKYQFGGFVSPISSSDRQWLINELKAWLELSESKRA
jgi:serine/threonine protein kinase